MMYFNAPQRARLQAALGIWTLLEMVPPHLGSAHQVHALQTSQKGHALCGIDNIQAPMLMARSSVKCVCVCVH